MLGPKVGESLGMRVKYLKTEPPGVYIETGSYSVFFTKLENFIKTNKLKHTKIIKTNNSTLKEIIKQQEIGKEYWRIALILSLLFFTLEILLIKLIKL